MSFDHCVQFILFSLLIQWAASSSAVSDDIFESYKATSRNLLQVKEKCPENFEDKNYTIITSRCKGPEYPADQCCPAFKEFACPIRDKINDPKTDCAQTMFSYINLYGRFPPGLFAHKCREGKEGLKCDEPTLPPSGSAAAVHSTSLLLTAGFLVLLPLML
ncbi:hypothetical protein AB3S75_009148 [Citrus x aurantiifolia]